MLTLPCGGIRIGEAKRPGPPAGGLAAEACALGNLGQGGSQFDDPAFPLQGARDMLSSAFPAFEALGDGAALEGHEAVFAHGWLTPNNEAMYRFMALHFGLPAAVNTTERAFAPLPCRTLTVTQTGRAMDSLPGVGGRGPYRDLQTPQD